MGLLWAVGGGGGGIILGPAEWSRNQTHREEWITPTGRDSNVAHTHTHTHTVRKREREREGWGRKGKREREREPR